MAQKLFGLAIAATLALSATYLFSAHKQQPETEPNKTRTLSNQSSDFQPKTVIEKPFDAITEAPFQTAEEGSKILGDAMLVLGVEYDGVAKAYPIGMLCGPSREIINDTFGEHAVAATW